MWLDLRRFTSPELELDRVFSALPVIYYQSLEPQQIVLFVLLQVRYDYCILEESLYPLQCSGTTMTTILSPCESFKS